jgi:hypothetical protein
VSWPPKVHEIVDVNILGDSDRAGTQLGSARVLWCNDEELAVHGPDHVCPFEYGSTVRHDCIIVHHRLSGEPGTLVPILSWSESRNSLGEETYRFRLEPPSALDELLTAST